MRTIRYREIARDLQGQIDAGEFAAGRLLPSEADLSAIYRASRVTVRKALDELRSEGLVDSRQGLGWFVSADPLRQPLGYLGTIEDQLEAAGVASERRILDFGVVKAAPAAVRRALGPAPMLRVRRVNLADGEPFARVTVWCPERLAAGLERVQVAERSFYELLPVSIGGATQTIEAGAASNTDADLLGVPAGSPVLTCLRITSDTNRQPILIGESVFPGHRTAFTVDLPHVAASIAPSGLRLVE